MTVEGGVDTETLGRATWTFLHTLAATVPQEPSQLEQSRLKRFMNDFVHLYPCAPCAESFREIVKANSIDVQSGPSFAKWMCTVHNEVNKELGKALFDCAKVGERWGVCEQCQAHQHSLERFKSFFKKTTIR